MADPLRDADDHRPARRLNHEPAEPLPPRREQLPLPRRTQRAHIAPQLRDPDTAGSGTPFAAFTPSTPGRRPAAEQDTAAAFLDGTRQARRRTRHGPAGDD